MLWSIENDTALAKGHQQLNNFVEKTLIKSAFPVISEQDGTTKQNVQQYIWGAMIWWKVLGGGENSGLSHRLLKWSGLKLEETGLSLCPFPFFSPSLEGFQPFCNQPKGTSELATGQWEIVKRVKSSFICNIKYIHCINKSWDREEERLSQDPLHLWNPFLLNPISIIKWCTKVEGYLGYLVWRLNRVLSSLEKKKIMIPLSN